MSKEQLTEQQPGQETSQATEVQEQTYGLNPRLVAQIKQIPPGDDAALAAMLQLYPSLMGSILAVASHSLGIAMVRRAIALAKRPNAQGRGGSQSQEFVAEMLATPADSKPTKDHEMASTLEDKSDPQAPDETPSAPKQAPAADPAWVAEARQYNDAHADLVSEFEELTDYVCQDDDTTKLDPVAVSNWQREHGLDPDGKVGPRTVAAARAAKSKGAAVTKTEQPEERIPV